jgi:hypothetical protein
MQGSDWITVLGILVATASFWFALWQYNQTQKWKRAEFVAKEYNEYSTIPNVILAMQILDWPNREIELLSNKRKARIENQTLAKVMTPPDFEPPYDDLSVAIRDSFDEFLEGLAHFDHYIQAGLVSKDEFRPYLIYLLELLANPNKMKRSREAQDMILKYAEYYTPSVIRLLKRYGYSM